MQKLLLIPVFALIAGLSGCDNEDGPSSLSKTDAKAKISEFNATATQDLQALADAEGVKALASLSDLTTFDDPFGRARTDQKKLRAFLRKKGSQFKSIFSENTTSGRVKGSEPFDFNGNKGVYEWNSVDEVFVKTGTSNIIVIKFPAEGSETNNAELQLSAYEEVQFYDAEWEEYSYEPSLIDASVLVDGTEVASLNVDIDWDDNGFPLSGELTATVVPFTATVSFDVSGSTKNTLSASLTKNTETLFATSISVLYSSATKSEETLKSIDGFVQLKNLKLDGSINVADMDAVQGEIDLNDFVKLALYSDGKKLGDIVFVTEEVDGFQEDVAYLKYSDGTKEKLETVLQPVIDELDQLSADLNG
jgi:hypothetical protein